MQKTKVITLQLDSEIFNPDTIINSGQVFRMFKNDGFYFAYSGNKAISFRKIQKNIWNFYTTQEDWTEYWYSYFDLSTDYTEFNNEILKSNDNFLKNSLNFSKGMRILKQDLWETMVTFIISQQNNIPKITKTVNILCEKFGTPCYHEIDSIGSLRLYYTFPTVDQIANLSIEKLSGGTMLGYRAEYILKLAQDIQKRKFSLKKLSTLPYDNAIENLQTVKGIGLKVSNCIALYGLHLMESYPIDTWMSKIIKDNYSQYNSTSEYLRYINSNYKGFQGYVQQLQFYYKRNL